MSAYSIIWSLIEPLNVPEKIVILASNIDRRTLHITLALLVGSHFTLLLVIINKWIYNKKESQSAPNLEIQERDININPYYRKFSPKRNDLIVERVWMKDGKITQSAFASRVLLALNCKILDEKFANELLRGCSFVVEKLSENNYILRSDHKKRNKV